MAFTVTARHSTNAGQTSAQTRATGSATPTANSLFLVFFGAENDNHATVPAPQTPVGGGWTYTQRATSGVSTAYEWDGTTGFRLSQALYTAPIGGSPGAHTVTVDMYSTTNVGFYSAICLDVTGHDPGGTPLYYANGANIPTASDSASGTVTLGATPAVGALVVVSFYAGADSGGTMSAATVGGQSMTAVTVQTNTGFSLQGVWSREWTGAESNLVITCPDLGQQVGSYTAIAVVIPAAAGGGGVTGTVAVTQASDISTASGQLGYSGTSAATQAANTASASGKLGYSGTVAATQASQTAAAVGQLGYTGTVAATQAAQTADASGVFTAGGSFAGTIAVTQANQVAAAAGKLGYSGTIGVAQASNTSAASGTVINPVTGSIAVTQANQTASAVGVLRYMGTVAVSQGSDIASIQGIFFIPITGTITATQADQTANASGSALGATVPRPDIGATSQPGSGITPRPFAGITERP